VVVVGEVAAWLRDGFAKSKVDGGLEEQIGVLQKKAGATRGTGFYVF
jgi:hypothetical protein